MKIAIALSALILAGCGATRTVTVTQTTIVTVTTMASPAPIDPSLGHCKIYYSGTEESMDVSGAGAGSVCGAIIRKWSSSSGFWSRHGMVDTAASSIVCRLVDSGVELDVVDAWAESFGTADCGRLIAAGWTQL